MVKIRLRRVGAKHKPMYRLVATDHRSPRDGAFIEVIGSYNPLTDPETLNVDSDKALKWLENGAQPSQTAYKLLVRAGVMSKFQSTHPERKFKQAIQKTTQKAKKKSKSSAEVSSQ
jgi:small subunit ribosomal protein S16